MKGKFESNSFPAMEELNLYGGMLEGFENNFLPKLKYLTLSSNPLITAFAIGEQFGASGSLEVLELARLPNLASLEIDSRCGHLRRLTVPYNGLTNFNNFHLEYL